MHGFANPARFLKIARPATGWLLAIGLVLVAAGIVGGLTLTPPDYLQGETVRILYIHVPAAWLGMAGWAGIAAASLSQLVWRHPLAAVAGRAIAPAGRDLRRLCLATGSIWGRPTWGTWWEWDGRLTSMLILFFLYLGYIALAAAERERGGEGRIAASSAWSARSTCRSSIIRCCGGARSTRGRASAMTGSSIAPELLWPLPLTMLGFTAAVRRGRADADARRARRRPRSRRGCGGWRRNEPLAVRHRRLCGRPRRDRGAARSGRGARCAGPRPRPTR